jgi:hypothetical protein
MKNEKVQILEFIFCWSLTIEFISETIRDRGDPSTCFHNLLAQSIQRKKLHQNWIKNKKIIYLQKCGISIF